MMMLENMMWRQRGLMTQLEAKSGQPLTMQEAVHGVVKEAAEILDVLQPGTKPWAATTALSEADTEAIDVMMYLLEYFLIRGYAAADIHRMFNNKHDIVQQRLETKSLKESLEAKHEN